MKMSNLPDLVRIAQGRDHINTAEFGRATNRRPQTIRKNLCIEGAAYGIRPLKVRGRLLWPVADIAALLAAEEIKA